MRTVVVLEARTAQNRQLWAWCLVGQSGVGFEEITFSEVDGRLIGDLDPSEQPRLGAKVFDVPVREAHVNGDG